MKIGKIIIVQYATCFHSSTCHIMFYIQHILNSFAIKSIILLISQGTCLQRNTMHKGIQNNRETFSLRLYTGSSGGGIGCQKFKYDICSKHKIRIYNDTIIVC